MRCLQVRASFISFLVRTCDDVDVLGVELASLGTAVCNFVCLPAYQTDSGALNWAVIGAWNQEQKYQKQTGPANTSRQ